MRRYQDDCNQRMKQGKFAQPAREADSKSRANDHSPDSPPAGPWDTAEPQDTSGEGIASARPIWSGAGPVPVDSAWHDARTAGASQVWPQVDSSAAIVIRYATATPAGRPARHTAGSVIAFGALPLCGVTAACTPACRPSARSAIAHYVGHSSTLLRTFIDARPQVVLTTFNDGLRRVCIL